MYNGFFLTNELKMPNKSFSSFRNIKLSFGQPEKGLNFGYTCLANFSCKADSSFDDEFFLLYRRSQYAAQVELCCAKIFKALMGYGPEMEIIEENKKFFIASRRIKNFKEGCPQFKDPTQFKNTKGLAALFVISYFLGETDMQSKNYGMQVQANEQKAFKIDMAEALDYKMLKTPPSLSALKRIPYIVEQEFYGVHEEDLPTFYVGSAYFQNEKIAMIRLIASTPFSLFENIIRSTISSDFYSHQKAMFEKFQELAQDEQAIHALKESFSKIDPQEYNLESLIQVLKERHEQWQSIILHNNLEQDFSLAPQREFMRELNALQTDSSDNNSNDNDSDVNESELEYSHSLRLG